MTLFNSCIGTTIEDQHIQRLDKIRAHVWEEVQNEFHLPPSHTALKLHWLRTACVLNMWAQASANKITTLPPTEYGWIKEDGGYNIQYDTEERVLIVRQRVSKFTRGCTYKGGCKSKRCGCKKNGQQCGPGCRCLNCENLLTSDTIQPELDHELGIAREVVIGNDPQSESECETASESEINSDREAESDKPDRESEQDTDHESY